MAEVTKSVAELCLAHQMTIAELAGKSQVDEQRLMAIVMGRWTPSPQDRDAIARVFNLTREQIGWGHNTPIQHIYGHGPG